MDDHSEGEDLRTGFGFASSDRGTGALVFVVAVLLQLPIFDRSIVAMDEGHLATVAMGLQDGLALYRDLHTGIFPGIYHLTALLFSLLGNDLLVARCAEVAVNASVALCLWLAGLRAMPRPWAAIAPALYLAVVAMSFPVLAMFNYSSLSLAFSMASLVFTMQLLDHGRRGSAIGLGITLALAVLCKQNFGALAFAAAGIGLVWNRSESVLAERPWSQFLCPIAASGVAVTLVFVVYFLATGTLVDFLYATVIQLGGDQMESFNNPIPPVFGQHPISDSKFIFLYSPPYLFNAMLHGETLLGLKVDSAFLSTAIRLSYGLALATLVAAALVWLGGVGVRDTRERCGTRLVVGFALLFFLGIFPSAIWSHLAFVLPPVLLALAMCLARIDTSLRGVGALAAKGFRVLVASGVVLALIVGAIASADIARWFPAPMGLERATLHTSRGQTEIYRRAVAFVEGCAAEDEAIFVAPTMPVLYFLTGRPNVSRYDLTIPGNVDGQRIIDALEAGSTRCVVYNPAMYPEFPPFAELFPALDHYLKTRYATAQQMRGGGETWLGLVRKAPPRDRQ
ncbi:MAG: hypothetical protein GY944_21075 [bacterium]|nr:hypothetical protein [bacterium]